MPEFEVFVPRQFHTGNRPGLQEVKFALGDSPLEVLWIIAIQLHHSATELTEFTKLRAVQRKALTLRIFNILLNRAETVFPVTHDTNFLGADSLFLNAQITERKHVFVRRGDTGHQGFAQSIGCVDHDLVGGTG